MAVRVKEVSSCVPRRLASEIQQTLPRIAARHSNRRARADNACEPNVVRLQLRCGLAEAVRRIGEGVTDLY